MLKISLPPVSMGHICQERVSFRPRLCIINRLPNICKGLFVYSHLSPPPRKRADTHMRYKASCTKFVLNINNLICFKIINGCLIIRMTLLLSGILTYHSHMCCSMTSMLNLSTSKFWKLFFEATYKVLTLNDATFISFGNS